MSQRAPRLADLVRADGPLEPDAVARLLLPVAESLTTLHAHRAVHGALSPSAVLVGEGGPTLLAPGSVEPDPSFTSPEVAAGTGLDHHADVWSFAGLLLHTSTGRSPYSPPTGPRDGGWLRPVIELGLHPDPTQRPLMSDVAAYLRARVSPAATPSSDELAAAVSGPGRRSGASGLALVLTGAAVIALLGVSGAILLLGGDGDGERATEQPTRTGLTSTTPSPTTPPRRHRPQQPTGRQLEAFARRYVETASTDPERGFEQLTPTYQRASPRYHEVWSAIEHPQVLAVDADPSTSSVSYIYRYRLPGGRGRTEEVTLHLVQRGGRLLIAGASSRPH